MNTSDDSTVLTNKKKTRSFVSFFMDKQIPDTNEYADLSKQKPDPALTYYRGQSIIPKQWQTIPSSTTYNESQIQMKHHSYGYLQMFDELINENNSCFGFSLLHITSKYCLYMSIIIFLGICLIISFTAIFKK